MLIAGSWFDRPDIEALDRRLKELANKYAVAITSRFAALEAIGDSELEWALLRRALSRTAFILLFVINFKQISKI